jgi:hypothetical protein
MFQAKVLEKIETHILCSITFFPKMSKNVVETKGPQMMSQYGAYALRAGLARLYARMHMHTPTHSRKHAGLICNTYCSSTATMVL